jgi:hypothetical protein
MRLLAPALLLALAAAPAAAQNMGPLKFMAGCWQGNLSDDTIVEEIWTPPAENLVLGLTRYIEKSRATSWEFTFIERTDTTVIFVAATRGEKPDTFYVQMMANEAVSFARPGDEFPNVIFYRLVSDGSLIARLEGPTWATVRSLEVRLERVKCPGK